MTLEDAREILKTIAPGQTITATRHFEAIQTAIKAFDALYRIEYEVEELRQDFDNEGDVRGEYALSRAVEMVDEIIQDIEEGNP